MSKNKQTECFVSGSLAKVLRVTRFLCLAPLWFVQERQGWRIGYSAWRHLVACIFITIINIAIIWSLIIEPPSGFNSTVTQRLVSMVKNLVMLFTVDIITIGSSRLVRCIISTCCTLNEINVKLNIHHWPYQKNQKCLGLYIVWILLSYFIYSMDIVKYLTTTDFSVKSGLTRTVVCAHYFCYGIRQMGMFQFMVFVFHIQGTFKAINDGLRQLTQDPNVNDDWKEVALYEKYRAYEIKYCKKVVKTIIDPWTKHKNVDTDPYVVPHEAVRRISMQYVSACGVVPRVNRSYGLTLLMYLCVALLRLITTPYDFIVSLITGNFLNANIYIHIIEQFYWCIFYMSTLMVIIECCHITHVEMEATRKLVAHLMRYTKSVHDPLAVEVEMFCKHIELNEVFYKPLGITTMTRGLIVTILSSVTTYLAILVDIK